MKTPPHLSNELGDEVGRHGQKVDSVGHLCRCLNCRNVGIHQNYFNIFFFHRFDRLRTRVIEFTGLTNGQTARTEQQHCMGGDGDGGDGDGDGTSQCTSSDRVRGRLHCDGGNVSAFVSHTSQEHIKEERRISWSTLGFWMELHREERLVTMDDTLVGVIIRVAEEWGPVIKAMVSVTVMEMVMIKYQSEGKVSSSTAKPWFWGVI